jgi:hypothetical protein
MHVRIYIKGWKGTKEAPIADADVLFVTHLEFEGKRIDYTGEATLNLGGAYGDFLTLQIGGVHPEDFKRLIEEPENFTQHSTPKQTGIIVSGLEIVEDHGPIATTAGPEDLLRSAPREIVPS